MTAIAYCDGKMAADTAVWTASLISGFVRKIEVSPAGELGASCGQTSSCERFRAWVKGGLQGGFRPDDDDNKFYAIVVRLDGSVQRIDPKGRAISSVVAPFHAIGGARDFLAGALASGAPPDEAVRLAIQWIDFAAGDVQVALLGCPGVTEEAA